MESERPTNVRLPGSTGAEGSTPAQALRGSLDVNETAELVFDLLAHAGLVAPDQLALVRGRIADGHSITVALVEEGVAPADGIARMLAVRHHLPVVDLATSGVAVDAAQLIPIPTLERAVAVPYAFEDDVLKI